MRIHLVPNSHIDPVWLWDKYEGIDEVINTFRTACSLLDRYPGLTFTASSIQFHEWVLEFDPELFRRIQAHVAADRWEVAGCWWVEADSNLPTAESLRRHAGISQAFCLRHFGRRSEVAYLPDSFGHPATLPAILADTGFSYFLFSRPGIHEKPDLPANLFWWEHEGRRVLAYRLKHHYTQGGPGRLGQDLSPILLPKLQDPEYGAQPVNAYLFGVGDHGGGPAMAEVEFYNGFLRSRPAGDAGYSSCLRFFREACQVPGIPTYAGDLHMHAVGCYSVMRPLKDAMRRCEHGLAFAERALALAGRKNDSLAPLWKTVLFNQFHDILPGSCAPIEAAQAIAELGGVESGWRDAAYTALKSVAASQPVRAPEGEFRVFNTLPFEITRAVQIESCMYYRKGAAFRDEAGRDIAIQEVLPTDRCANRRWEFVDTLPARGFRSYSFDSATLVSRPPGDAAHFQAGCAISTAAGEVTAEGLLLIDPRDSRHALLAAPLQFLVLRDASDTWGHGVRKYDDVVGAFAQEDSSIVTGPVVSRLRQRWSWGRSVIDCVISLYEHLPQVCVDITVRWLEERAILKMELLPAGCSAPVFSMQAPGGAVERLANGEEMPLHHWVRLPGAPSDFGLIQDGAFACDCADGRLRLTLVRSSVYSHHDPAKLAAADPQRHTDQGEHRFRLWMTAGTPLTAAGLDRMAQALLEPCPVLREGPA